jgi:hypothetical protein
MSNAFKLSSSPMCDWVENLSMKLVLSLFYFLSLLEEELFALFLGLFRENWFFIWFLLMFYFFETKMEDSLLARDYFEWCSSWWSMMISDSFGIWFSPLYLVVCLLDSVILDVYMISFISGPWISSFPFI